MSDYEMLPTFEFSINNELPVRVQLVINIKDAVQNLYEIDVRQVTCLESGKDWTMWLDLNMLKGCICGSNWISKEAVE